MRPSLIRRDARRKALKAHAKRVTGFKAKDSTVIVESKALARKDLGPKLTQLPRYGKAKDLYDGMLPGRERNYLGITSYYWGRLKSDTRNAPSMIKSDGTEYLQKQKERLSKIKNWIGQ